MGIPILGCNDLGFPHVQIAVDKASLITGSNRDERWSRHNQILESKYVDILYVEYNTPNFYKQGALKIY